MTVVFLLLFALGYLAAYLIPADGFAAFDWVRVFAAGRTPDFYPPWVGPVVGLLNWNSLVGLTFAGIGTATIKRAAHPVSAVCAILSLPVVWLVFLGQLEGLVVVGLLGLPWLAPLALLKPQVAAFAFLARRSWIAAGVAWIAVSLVVWGWWPARMLATNSYYAEGRYVQDISIGLVGLVVALPLLLLSRGDPDLLMMAGAFCTLHFIPYNGAVFCPAIARLRPGHALAALALSYLPLSANWLGPAGWWLGWLFVAWLWFWTWRSKHEHDKGYETVRA